MINFVAPINDIDMTQPKASQKVTVVTVCYNAVKEIEKTIQSVIGQTYDNVEYIIVDGGSTDGTLDIIRKYSSRITRWVSEPDKGIFDAMNKSARMATGEYINFMNAGDLFLMRKCSPTFLPAAAMTRMCSTGPQSCITKGIQAPPLGHDRPHAGVYAFLPPELVYKSVGLARTSV